MANVPRRWRLFDDRGDKLLFAGTEGAVKVEYHQAILRGDVLEVDAYVQDPAGEQYAWNRYRKRWDQLGVD